MIEDKTGDRTLLVDMKPGSNLEKRLATLEHKLDHIFALMVSAQGLTRDDIESPHPDGRS